MTEVYGVFSSFLDEPDDIVEDEDSGEIDYFYYDPTTHEGFTVVSEYNGSEWAIDYVLFETDGNDGSDPKVYFHSLSKLEMIKEKVIKELKMDVKAALVSYSWNSAMDEPVLMPEKDYTV
jgi:hypothetical protein